MALEINNWKHWQHYTSGLSSPQNYIDWAYIYLIGASLQRRVWCPPSHKPCFANMYIILVGKPGIGKGLIIGEVSDCLKYWKLSDIPLDTSNVKSEVERVIKEEIQKGDLKAATENEFQGKSKGAEMAKPLLFPVAADATTYEALVQAVSESYRRVDFIKPDNTPGIYGHSSLCFSLQELASLMRKRTDDTVNYLLGLYDCPLDYEYITKTKGKDRVRRGCLNLLAGTTSSFMQSTFDEKLAGEGFTSRVFYIYANKNRKNQFFVPALSEEQKASKQVIVDHLLKLSKLYGQVHIDPETWQYLHQWWDKQETNQHLRSNKSMQLVPYYARKNIHVMKVAMAGHFGESIDMHIPLERFEWAIKFLEEEEKNMHFAITLEMDNVEARVAKRIITMLETGKRTYIDILLECMSMGKDKDIQAALEFLGVTGQVDTEQIPNELKGSNDTYYKLKGT